MPTRIILDTDTGVDDALAILLAMRSPELHVEAITAVSGNVHVDKCARNILLTLERLDLDAIPDVAKGEAAPLVKPPFIAGEVHGEDGIGGITGLLNPDGSRLYPDPADRLSPVSAVDLILDRIGMYPDEITLIAVGPLTNVARAIIKNPSRMRKLRQIVIMGGVFRVYGNVSPVAEFNIFVDPHAAQVVCDTGIPLIFVPLDVTMQAILTAERITQGAATGGPVAAFVRDCTAHYVDFHRQRRNVDGCFMHDPLAVAVAFRPDLVEMVDARVDVETAGDLTIGMTVADLRPGRLPPAGANARVCVDVNAEAFLTLFTERVLYR
ncbi:MAG: nucleoside hydrolase [Candidatus Latescibacteria bacterium]|nr:nucleoside hydrolase [Candidatus Latescibacterota bacterium]